MVGFPYRKMKKMGESERFIEKRFRKITLGQDNNALMALITINLILFASIGIIQIIYFLTDSTTSAFQYEILRWFIMPAKLSVLAKMPWTVLTHLFVHTGVIYTLVTLLWLWAFGSILQDLSGNDKIFPLYIYGGLAGAFVFTLSNYLIPSLRGEIEYSTLIGGNAGVMAIAVATTTLAPNYRLFRMLNGGIPLWVLTCLYIVIDVSGVPDMAGRLSHLGGALIGYLFVISLKKGYNWGAWMNNLYYWAANLFNPENKVAGKQKAKELFFYNTGGKAPFVKRMEINQQTIDLILDKINQKGYEHLTEEEKNILKRASESEF